MDLQQELTERGFINQTSADLGDILSQKRTVYLGVDPTADSIHAGNFVIYMLLRHLANHGHNILLLAGGGTGRIGDPKPDAERVLIDYDEVDRRVEKLQTQAAALLDIAGLEIVDNNDWLGKMNLIDFLRDIGKHFTVGELIKKDAIATRLASDTGLSYTEFAYPLLQGYDFLELHRTYGCDVQVGGSDQWGNIVAGVDLVRRKEQVTVHAVTVPLVIDKATGRKFGKSEGNAVWLDPEKTSPYEFYQFWLNASDESVVDYLKLFTFISLEEIAALATEHQADSAARVAQRRLASEVTALVHGQAAAAASAEVSTVLFGGGRLAEVSDDARQMILTTAPACTAVAGDLIVDVLIQADLASSKREARQFIADGAVTIDGEKVTDADATISAAQYQLVRRGKKRLCVVLVK